MAGGKVDGDGERNEGERGKQEEWEEMMMMLLLVERRKGSRLRKSSKRRRRRTRGWKSSHFTSSSENESNPFPKKVRDEFSCTSEPSPTPCILSDIIRFALYKQEKYCGRIIRDDYGKILVPMFMNTCPASCLAMRFRPLVFVHTYV